MNRNYIQSAIRIKQYYKGNKVARDIMEIIQILRDNSRLHNYPLKQKKFFHAFEKNVRNIIAGQVHISGVRIDAELIRQKALGFSKKLKFAESMSSSPKNTPWV